MNYRIPKCLLLLRKAIRTHKIGIVLQRQAEADLPLSALFDQSALPGGVMVTQGFLVPSFLVRVQAG
jgi:hypothetical protein